jgi:hypothetical protein
LTTHFRPNNNRFNATLREFLELEEPLKIEIDPFVQSVKTTQGAKQSVC